MTQPAEARLADDTLVLDTGRCRRTFRFNRGHLVTRELFDREGGWSWPMLADAPDLSFEGLAPPRGEGSLEVSRHEPTAESHAHLRVEVVSRHDGLQVRRTFRLYDGCPIIPCGYAFRGRLDYHARRPPEQAMLDNLESLGEGRGRPLAMVADRLRFVRRHLSARAVRFYDVTDRRNNLVHERDVLAYTSPTLLDGNLLFVADQLSDRRLIYVKHSPCSDVQLSPVGYDFAVSMAECHAAGLGVDGSDVGDDWTAGYSIALGVGGSDLKARPCRSAGLPSTTPALRPRARHDDHAQHLGRSGAGHEDRRVVRPGGDRRRRSPGRNPLSTR